MIFLYNILNEEIYQELFEILLKLRYRNVNKHTTTCDIDIR